MTDTNNALPQNSIGDALGVNILNQSIQHAESVISRTEIIENELFSLPLHIQNLNWRQFCAVNCQLKLVGSNFEKELCEEQVILSETTTFADRTRLIISHPNHQIPNIEGADHSRFYTKNDKQPNNKGFILEQIKGNMGLVSYISFLPGKKIIGLFIRRNSINMFYYVGLYKTETGVPNISINRDLTPRSISGNLTETDKVVISNASTKFRNQVHNWYYLKDALSNLYSLIFKTIDPAYISKLMVLNKTLSFSNNTE